jgi:hypothetical protein
MISRQDQITFIFAIFFIDQNDHPASTELGDYVFCGGKGIWHSSLF